MRSQQGSFSLVVVILVTPIIMVVSLITIGISKFYYQQQIIQFHLDQASILAVKSLPNVTKAKNIIDQYLDSKQIKANQLMASVDFNQVSLSYESEYQLKFSDYFIDLKIPLKVFSSAAARKQSIHLVIDVSPPSEVIANEYWPVAQFIEDNFQAYQWSRFAVSPSKLTSNCFNQEVNLLKLVALELVDYFYIQRQGELTAWTQQGGSDLPLRLNQGLEVSKQEVSEYCLAAAWNETFFAPYQLPFESNIFDQRIDLNSGEIKPEYLVQLSLLERIWGLSQTSPASFDLNYQLEAIITHLGSNSASESNLKIIILAQQAPWGFKNSDFQERLRQQLTNLTNYRDTKKVNLYYLIISNQPSLGDTQWQEYLESLAKEYEDRLKIQFIISAVGGELGGYVNHLINDGQSYVLLQ